MNQGAPGNTLCGEEVEQLERAAALIAGMLQHPGLRDPALAWAVQPSHGFSGDAVAARRTASGRLLAMLADATGHGLAAAGSLLPALQVFYAEADNDRPPGALAREINRRLQSAGRTGRFIAAVIVDIDPDGKRAAVWNGGMPAGLWLCGQSEAPTDALRSLHLPLGILVDAQFDATCTSLNTGAGGHLMFFSDGLIEAAGPAGEAFGVPRLRRHLLEGSAVHAVERVQAAVREHLGDARATDDISLLLIGLD
jgi:serine phosphatase RsbU (regulator of sigma subunit)